MIRVLVLGSTGMLGHKVFEHLACEPTLQVEGTAREATDNTLELDAESGIDGLRDLFEQHGPYAYVINCIGITANKIDTADGSSVRRAVDVNTLFPQKIAAAAEKAQGSRVLHISTDAVFSGTSGACVEDKPADAVDVYGRSKKRGELHTSVGVTLRCSLVGTDPVGKRGLLEWFLSRPEGSEVKGYGNQVWNGVTTLQFAELCRRIIVEDTFLSLREESPLHHFCPNTAVTKFELLKLFKRFFRRDITVVKADGPQPIRRTLTSRYRVLEELFGHDIAMEKAVGALADGRRRVTTTTH